MPRQPALIEIVPLSEEDRSILAGYYENGYLHGHCVPLAIALARATGAELVILRTEEGRLIHAGVRTDAGELRDIRGVVEELEFRRPYGGMGPLRLVPTTETALLAEVPDTTEKMIERAGDHLCELFDDLPQAREREEKIRVFLGALSDLCTAHGFWLRGELPNSIVLYPAYGDEAGFKARAVPGGTLRLERLLGEAEVERDQPADLTGPPALAR
jgi:hypothetical protein